MAPTLKVWERTPRIETMPRCKCHLCLLKSLFPGADSWTHALALLEEDGWYTCCSLPRLVDVCRLKTFDTKHAYPELENPVGGNLGYLGSVLPSGYQFISVVHILSVYP